jgi:hypothetical protein
MHTIQDGSMVKISTELSLGVRKQRQVEFFFFRAEIVPANDDGPWW